MLSFVYGRRSLPESFVCVAACAGWVVPRSASRAGPGGFTVQTQGLPTSYCEGTNSS